MQVIEQAAEVHGGPQVSSNKGALLPPVEFPFPFQPYDIQKGFMRELYSSIEQGGLGIFESPTGTVQVCAVAATYLGSLGQVNESPVWRTQVAGGQ